MIEPVARRGADQPPVVVYDRVVKGYGGLPKIHGLETCGNWKMHWKRGLR